MYLNTFRKETDKNFNCFSCDFHRYQIEFQRRCAISTEGREFTRASHHNNKGVWARVI